MGICSMNRLHIFYLLFWPISCQLHRIGDWFEWERRCGLRSGHGNIASWYAQVYNVESRNYYGAAVISQRHAITVKGAVTKLVNGAEIVLDAVNIKVIPIMPKDGEKSTTYNVQHTLIPVRLEQDKPVLLNLAILQVVEPFHENVTYACPVTNGRWPNPPFEFQARHIKILLVTDNPLGHDAGIVAFDRVVLSCNELHCEEYLTKNRSRRPNQIGDIWYTAIEDRRRFGNLEEEYFDYLVGIGIDSKYTLSVAFWSDFMCKHTGVCRLGIWEMSDIGNADYHFLFDGQLKYESCSQEERREMILMSTPFRRIPHSELAWLRMECGRSKNRVIPEEEFSFLVTIVAYSEKCVYQHQDCDESEVRTCSGVLLSPSHIIASAECLKKILINRAAVVVLFNDHDHYEGEQFPFQEEELVIPHYDTSRVGKRWMRVDRMTTPYTGDETIHDIALLQLGRIIPPTSYIKPICISSNSQELQDTLKYAWIELKKEPSTNLMKRFIKNSTVDVIVPEKCSITEDCDMFAVKFEGGQELSDHNMGSPVFHEQGERKYLDGYLSHDETGKIHAVRPSYFTSFICLHTGVCEENESLRSRLFMLYDYKNIEVPPYVLMHELNDWKLSSQLDWKIMENEMASVVQKLADNKYKLNRISEEEFEEIKEECGRIPAQNRIIDGNDFEITEHPWPVTVAVDRGRMYDPRGTCGGAFISRRHVVTAKHCVVDPQKYLILYGSRESDDMDTLHRVPVKNVIFIGRWENHVKWYYDLAVLELFENIETIPQTQILCVANHTTYEDDAFSPIARVYGGGRGDFRITERIHYLEYNFTTDDPKFVRVTSYDSHAVEELGWWSREGRGYTIQGDSGGPLVRARLSDGRFTFYGVVRSAGEGTAIAHFTRIAMGIDSICKMSGVCPGGKIDPTNLHEITVNGLRLC